VQKKRRRADGGWACEKMLSIRVIRELQMSTASSAGEKQQELLVTAGHSVGWHVHLRRQFGDLLQN
jgi:hypothetical protein